MNGKYVRKELTQCSSTAQLQRTHQENGKQGWMPYSAKARSRLETPEEVVSMHDLHVTELYYGIEEEGDKEDWSSAILMQS